MYIKVIKKNDKTYYILAVCDSKTKIWIDHFIEEQMALQLINECNIKFKEII